MSYTCFFLIILLQNVICFSEAGSSDLSNDELETRHFRKLLVDAKHTHSGNKTHNNTKETKVSTPNPINKDESLAGTEVAVLFIVAVIVLSVIGMVIYFLRKFEQLNRSLPTYRYSSLKTEINGYGPDDKECQHLVNVSTEEEDDDEEEVEDLEFSPPTLMVRSQTVMPTKPMNGAMPVIQDGNVVMSNSTTKSVDSSVDSDDELLQ